MAPNHLESYVDFRNFLLTRYYTECIAAILSLDHPRARDELTFRRWIHPQLPLHCLARLDTKVSSLSLLMTASHTDILLAEEISRTCGPLLGTTMLKTPSPVNPTATAVLPVDQLVVPDTPVPAAMERLSARTQLPLSQSLPSLRNLALL